MYGYGIFTSIDPRSTTPGLIGKYADPMECLGLLGPCFQGQVGVGVFALDGMWSKCHVELLNSGTL